MNYLEDVVAIIRSETTGDVLPHELIQLYALLALVKGTAVTGSDVHDAWAVWRSSTDPDDPDVVPFEQLDMRAKAKDMPYVAIIRHAAERLTHRRAQ